MVSIWPWVYGYWRAKTCTNHVLLYETAKTVWDHHLCFTQVMSRLWVNISFTNCLTGWWASASKSADVGKRRGQQAARWLILVQWRLQSPSGRSRFINWWFLKMEVHESRYIIQSFLVMSQKPSCFGVPNFEKPPFVHCWGRSEVPITMVRYESHRSARPQQWAHPDGVWPRWPPQL